MHDLLRLSAFWKTVLVLVGVALLGAGAMWGGRPF